jgi:hypothetical protein
MDRADRARQKVAGTESALPLPRAEIRHCERSEAISCHARGRVCFGGLSLPRNDNPALHTTGPADSLIFTGSATLSTVTLRESGASNRPGHQRMITKLSEYWIARSSRATTGFAVLAEQSQRACSVVCCGLAKRRNGRTNPTLVVARKSRRWRGSARLPPARAQHDGRDQRVPSFVSRHRGAVHIVSI